MNKDKAVSLICLIAFFSVVLIVPVSADYVTFQVDDARTGTVLNAGNPVNPEYIPSDRNRNIISEEPLAAAVNSSPIVVHDHVFFGTSDDQSTLSDPDQSYGIYKYELTTYDEKKVSGTYLRGSPAALRTRKEIFTLGE